MAERKRPKAEEARSLHLVIQGDGLSPADISIRQLAELLEAAAAVLETLTREQGEETLQLSLVAVTKGSAAYKFRSTSAHAPVVIKGFMRAARQRGKGFSPEVRRGLERLHRASSRTGSLRLVAEGSKGQPVDEPVMMAAPFPETAPPTESATEVHGRVTAVLAKGQDGAAVRIKLDGGGQAEFGASQDTAQLAARMFNRQVRARVTYEVSEDIETPGEVLSLEAWENADLVGALTEARLDLDREGVQFPASEWLKELREHD